MTNRGGEAQPEVDQSAHARRLLQRRLGASPGLTTDGLIEGETVAEYYFRRHLIPQVAICAFCGGAPSSLCAACGHLTCASCGRSEQHRPCFTRDA